MKLRKESDYLDLLKLVINGMSVSVSDKRFNGLHVHLGQEEYRPKGSLAKLSNDRVTTLIDMLTSYLDPDALEPYFSIYKGSNITGRVTVVHCRHWFRDKLVRAGLVFYGSPFTKISDSTKQLGYLRVSKTPPKTHVWLENDKEEISKDCRRLGRPATQLEECIPKLTALLRKADIKLELPNYWAYEKQSLYRNAKTGSWYSHVLPKSDMFYRIYSDADEQGGRIFGHHYQNLKANLRPYLAIGGEKTVEIDYQSCQPSICYSLLGLERPSDDLYDIGDATIDRDLLKKAFLIGIGSEANGRPATALRVKAKNDRRESRSKKPILTYADAKEADRKFWEFHKPIAEFRCSGAWRRLQYEESQIALKVIAQLVRQKIAVLPLHDGFLVAERHKDALMQAMVDAVSELSCRPVPVLKGN
ncbi:hypothetical protein [Aureimonas sp. Leaf454]|uniref:hypothetical protein n=1 Tax=Aureimonas sp. Leaf454 TaxID=1736381 RepID=UPI0012E3D04F|nr:hypothetical protein [Aureimonas sp. Leaf454]